VNTWWSVARNALRPSYLPVMVDKVRRRAEPDTRAAATEWASSRSIAVDDYCRALDADLWADTQHVSARGVDDGTRRLHACGQTLGGGGAHPLLHFLVRRTRPHTVVETGVAAGWSSRAVLEALAINGAGELWSSDFPYFRLAEPEQYVGVVVPEELRAAWHLDVRGDRVALPAIVGNVECVDLFHYDSDKSVAGRRFAMDTVTPVLADGAIVLMDDIQDNVFFRDFVRDRQLDAVVFEFEGKYVGALGLETVG
jgi:hypothetical protein